MSETPPLVDVQWLTARQAGDNPVRAVDLRWSLSGPSGLARYRERHIPGAVFVDLDKDLAQPGGPGRHPFPSTEAFARLLGQLGIGPETHVVVYDDGGGQYAARLWFMLRVHGHERASVLDGGFAAWSAAGLPVTTEEPRIAPVAPPRLVRDESRLVDRNEVAALLGARREGGKGLLLDARAPERYRGDVEPVDSRAGHIPGAVNAPFANNLRDGRFRPAAELRALYERLGAASASPIVCSCGSGVTACHDILALELAGFPPAKLYVGSFSDWSSQKKRPIATGPEPG